MDELSEKNFISEGYALNAYPFLFWGFIVLLALQVIYNVNQWSEEKRSANLSSSSYLRVTNREFSLFLWQYPHLMRVHAKNKIGYLPGFQYLHKVNMELEFSEDYVTVPPQILFQYHTWNRLLSSYSISRPISAEEFEEFLSCLEEWQPKNWPSAPKEYCDLYQNLREVNFKNFQSLTFEQLPKAVRQAFFGWKNYFKEGEAINSLSLTYLELENFLKDYPNYARNYWQNLVTEEYPNFLKTYTSGLYDKNSQVPSDEIAPFLRVALYNWLIY